MIGAGKYDDVLTAARTTCNGTAAMLIVIGGLRGSGFSCQAPPHILRMLPRMLRQVADQIEADQRKGQL